MRIALDACVLVPTIMREMLLGTAAEGAFAPIWSPRILEEWAWATRRLPEGAEAVAHIAIARMRARWPEAEVTPLPEFTLSLSLPDPGDRHVLAAAIIGEADTLLTLNRKDFPTRTLARHGLLRRDPDELLIEFLTEGYDVAGVAESVRAEAERLSGQPRAAAPLLKRAGLPRLARALAREGTRGAINTNS